MRLESIFNSSSYPFSLYSSTLVMQCEKLFSVISNRTAILNNQSLTPPYIRQLLAKRNLTLRIPKTIPECVLELDRLLNGTDDNEVLYENSQQNYGIQERSRSLVVFVFLIAFVSFISIIGNLCLAKILYSKRFRLLQTDRIVLCLAISELCLVLIDSPTEIYRFLSYSFTQTWLCRFHTFFESLFSSCIIFYHLLGAFDRFVYIHGHNSSDKSILSRWCRRISTKSCSIILLILPILCSLPIAICNLLHAHVLHTSSTMKICIVQYTHKILIIFLIFFYALPLLFSFFLHAKLIHFIRSKNHQHYSTKGATNYYRLSMKRQNTFDSQLTRRAQNQTALTRNQQLLQPKKIETKARRVVVFNNNDTIRNTAGSGTTTITTTAVAATAGQHTPKNNSSNSSGSGRSSNGTSFTSITSPITFYKINSQANANAKRTVLLLVLLLSFYVFCWAPYNIYTWTHAYQLTRNNRNSSSFNRAFIHTDFNYTLTSFTDNLHADLRRIIFINYSLYLLSMISMCFSFIFYFSLNKQARREFMSTIGCVCPKRKDNQRKSFLKEQPAAAANPRGLVYHTRYQHHYPMKKGSLSPPATNNPRIKTTKFKTHSPYTPPANLIVNQSKKINNPYVITNDKELSKRTLFNYGCHVQCCP